jgi:glucose-6-phosphate 1-epimerase
MQTTIDALNKQFATEKLARFDAGAGGLPRLVITAPAGEAHIYIHGAHVTHFQPAGGKPVLFLSSKSFFEPGKAIRGGVPLVFPWFGPRDGDKTAMHGIVRTRPWTVQEISRDGDNVKAVFAIASSVETRATWQHEFALRFIVTVGKSLTMDLEVKNTADVDFRFEEMTHTYVTVGDVRQCTVSGLTGSHFTDKNNLGPEKRPDSENPLRFKGPTDRVYLDTPATCTLTDPVLGRKIIVEKESSRSTVVWNPWSDRISSFVDMTVEDWPKFACVESCNVWDNAITLKPSETHTMRVRLRTESL